MKNITIIFLVLIIHFIASGQNEKLFLVKESFVSDSSLKKQESEIKKQDSNFYEDDNYIVSKTCSGEWGGTIKFKNKKTGIERSCSATCPVVVNKIDGKYIVTNTLAHMMGSSSVIEISNPDSLTIFKLPPPREQNGNYTIYYVGDDESKSTEGTKLLVDSFGVLTLASFPYKGQLFHIVTDFHKTFITIIKDKKFVTVDTLSNQSMWTYDAEVIKAVNNHYIVFFNNESVEGYMDIFENKINLIRNK